MKNYIFSFNDDVCSIIDALLLNTLLNPSLTCPQEPSPEIRVMYDYLVRESDCVFLFVVFDEKTHCSNIRFDKIVLLECFFQY